MTQTDRLTDVSLGEAGFSAATPETEQELRVAIFDLLEANTFALAPVDGEARPAGPYKLHLAASGSKLVFEISDLQDAPVRNVPVSLSGLRQPVKDYTEVCDAYYEAVRALPPAQIEAIDEGRKRIHDEGGRLLMEALGGAVNVDLKTARSLFSLICVLSAKT